MAQVFGWLGFSLFLIFYAPQTIKMLKTRDVRGLSVSAWVILWLGLFSYLVYSIALRNVVFTAGNAIGLAQASLQLVLILRYRNRRALRTDDVSE
ncbi:MAG: hypothetical protein HY669_03220 [Chloroflexi bacterium]|nr:hypothetical protein [Chloroflexota bacterium]